MRRRYALKTLFIFSGALWIPKSGILRPNPVFPQVFRGPHAGVIGAAAGGAASPTYLFVETFDATGYDGGAAWTESIGTPDKDYATSPAPLEGTQSLYMPGATNLQDYQIYRPISGITSGSKCECYFMMYIVTDTASNGSVREIARLSLNSNSVAPVSLVKGASSFKLRVLAMGGSNATTIASLTSGVKYHVWLTYQKGTGTNAVATVAFSTDGIRPSSGENFASSIDGTGTSDVNRVYIGGDIYGSGSAGVDMIYDRVIVADGSVNLIGNNP